MYTIDPQSLINVGIQLDVSRSAQVWHLNEIPRELNPTIPHTSPQDYQWIQWLTLVETPRTVFMAAVREGAWVTTVDCGRNGSAWRHRVARAEVVLHQREWVGMVIVHKHHGWRDDRSPSFWTSRLWRWLLIWCREQEKNVKYFPSQSGYLHDYCHDKCFWWHCPLSFHGRG